MKIYTKTGDKGQTGLFGGKRVPKSHLRVEAYGTVDELNAFVGLLADSLSDEAHKQTLHTVQNRLFSLGAYLAYDPDKNPPPVDLKEEDLGMLESEMDRMDALLPALRNFILPGGHMSVSYAHVCRTVCRRAERQVVALHRKSPLEPLAIQYLNRLSDYFFVLARSIAHDLGLPEHIWKGRKA